MNYKISDHIEFDESGLYGSGVIKDTSAIGWCVLLDEPFAGHGHTCGGRLPRGRGFYVEKCNVRGLVEYCEYSIDTFALEEILNA